MAADKENERLRSVIAVLERELAGTQSIAELRAKERDEWKAHAERMRDVAEILLLIDHCEECRKECGFNRDAVKRRLAETPAQSFANFKTVWQAEALERAAEQMPGRGLPAESWAWLMNEARRLRRQAESQQ